MATAVAVAVLVVLGVILRMWLLAHDPIDADQAVVGLMAQAIDRGHPMVFYWGQAYGGVEPYVTAALIAVFGLHPWVVNATPALLAAIGSLVAWRLVRALSGSSGAGAVAGALIWVWSEADLWSSTREYGFRGVVLVCSLLVLLAVAHLVDDDRRVGSWILLGAAAGLGWWASPEILYVAVPALVATVWIVVRAVRRHGAPALRPAAAGVVATGVALAPWLVGSVHDHFASLGEATAGQGPGAMGYTGRLQVFLVHTLPMVFGARLPVTGAWLGGRAVGIGVLAATITVLLAGMAVAARRLPAARVVVVAAVAYPFIEAAMGPTWYWRDGRYGMYLPAVAVVAAVAGWDRWLRGRRLPATAAPPDHLVADDAHDHGAVRAAPAENRGWRAAAAVAGCACAAASVVAGIDAATAVPGSTALSGFAAAPASITGHPDATARSVAEDLVAQHVTRAYADYWVAYDLDLFTGGRLVVTPARFVRAPTLAATVARAHRSAWLFAGPSTADVIAYKQQFQNPELGPMGMDASRFTTVLRAHGIAYRTVPVGAVVAIVPATPVTPQWVVANSG